MIDLLREKGISFILIYRKDKIIGFPEKEPKIQMYAKTFMVLKEGIDFSGFQSEFLSIATSSDEFIYIFTRDTEWILTVSQKMTSPEEILTVIKSLETPEKVKKVPTEEVRIIPSEIFSEVEKIMEKFVGAFSHAIFENQLKDAKIDIKNTDEKKFRKFVLGIQNATSMIIGPSQAKMMAQQILSLLSK